MQEFIQKIVQKDTQRTIQRAMPKAIEATLEHINVTVKDPLATANLLIDLFDWRIRWQGESKNGGFSVHVGGDKSYLALYVPSKEIEPAGDRYNFLLSLNHIGIVVDDLKATERKVIASGFKPHLNENYEPGQRFYFYAPDGLEIEVISY